MISLVLLSLLAQSDWSCVEKLPYGEQLVVTHSTGTDTGMLVSSNAKQLVMTSNDLYAPVTIARADVERVWIPWHRPVRRTMLGVAIGLAASIAPAMLVRSRSGIGAVSLVVTGTAVGGVLGASAPSGRELVYRK